MIYKWKTINEMYGNPLKVKEALDKGDLYKVGRGYYSNYQFVDPLLLVSAKYPYAIITMDTAFYIYGLTDVIPDKIFLATKRNATRINDIEIVQIFTNEKIFLQGKTNIEYEGVSIIIYDRERLLIEALRRSKSLPFDYYKEIVASYRKISDSLDYEKIAEYLSLFKKNKYLYDRLRREVL